MLNRTIYAPVKVNASTAPQYQLSSKIFLDSGNTLTKPAISRQFHAQLGAGFASTKQEQCFTAKRGTALKILGVSKPIEVTFTSLWNTKFVVNDCVVVDSLSEQLNFGTAWLQSHNMSLHFSKHGTNLQYGNKIINLISQMSASVCSDIPSDSLISESIMDEGTGADMGSATAAKPVTSGGHFPSPSTSEGSYSSATEISDKVSSNQDQGRNTTLLHRQATLPTKASVSWKLPLRQGETTAATPTPTGAATARVGSDQQVSYGLSDAILKQAGLPIIEEVGSDSDSPVVMNATTRPARGEYAHDRLRSSSTKTNRYFAWNVVSAITAVIPSRTATWVTVHPNCTLARKPGTYRVSDEGHDAPVYKQMKLVEAIYNQTNKVLILNETNDHIVIKKEEVIGKATPLCQYSQTHAAKEVGPNDSLVEHLYCHPVNPRVCAVSAEAKDHHHSPPLDKSGEDQDFLNQLIVDLKLMENKVLNEDPVMKKRVLDMIANYKDVFSSPENIVGKTDLMEFSIKLKPGSTPYAARSRAINPAQEESLKKRIDLWKSQGVIEECSSPWAAALVCVRKEGKDDRWCVDYRILNSKTVQDSYPLPNIQNNLDKLRGSTLFSTLDAAQAYNVVPVSAATKPLLAFTSPYGVFTYNRMPFGCCTAPQTYSKFVELCINKIRSPHVMVYLDDVIVHTSDKEKHLQELQRVLQCHREAGIKLRASKTILMVEEVDYLGYTVNCKGIQMKKDYLEKILSWPSPKTVAQLNTFLGFVQYYYMFIIDFSELTNEMNSQRRAAKLTWTSKMEENFKKLKAKFKKNPIRAYPDFTSDEPFIVTTDFSAINLAGILSQKQGKVERLIAAKGRKCSAYEQNYPSMKGELAAVLYALRAYEHILRFRRFLLVTDSAALKYLTTMKDPRGIMWRWIRELTSYDFVVLHKPGRKLLNADNLSRAAHLEPPSQEEIDEGLKYDVVGALAMPTNILGLTDPGLIVDKDNVVQVANAGKMEPRPARGGIDLAANGHIAQAGAAAPATIPAEREHSFPNVDLQYFKTEQEKDLVLAQVRSWTKRGHPPSKKELRLLPEGCREYAQIFEGLELDETSGCLYFKWIFNHNYQELYYRLCVPKSLQAFAFKHMHETKTAGHWGITNTIKVGQQHWFFPGMASYVTRKVASCDKCMGKKKLARNSTHDCVHQPIQHQAPGETIYLDIVGPLPTTKEGYKYILTCLDGWTKFVQAWPLKNNKAETVADLFIDRHVLLFGAPKSLKSDGGPDFVAKIWDQICDRLELDKKKTAPYSPWENIVERFHRSLASIMRCYLEREDPHWTPYISMATFAYNTKIHNSTGISPFEAWMGRRARMPISLVLPPPKARTHAFVHQYLQDTIDRFDQIFLYMRGNTDATIARNARLYTGKKPNYQKNELVWFFCTRKPKGKPDKLVNSWLGPYEVVAYATEVLVRIRKPGSDLPKHEYLVHLTRLSPFKGNRAREAGAPDELDLTEDVDEYAENLLIDENLNPSPDIFGGPLVGWLPVGRKPKEGAPGLAPAPSTPASVTGSRTSDSRRSSIRSGTSSSSTSTGIATPRTYLKTNPKLKETWDLSPQVSRSSTFTSNTSKSPSSYSEDEREMEEEQVITVPENEVDVNVGLYGSPAGTSKTLPELPPSPVHATRSSTNTPSRVTEKKRTYDEVLQKRSRKMLGDDSDVKSPDEKKSRDEPTELSTNKQINVKYLKPRDEIIDQNKTEKKPSPFVKLKRKAKKDLTFKHLLYDSSDETVAATQHCKPCRVSLSNVNKVGNHSDQLDEWIYPPTGIVSCHECLRSDPHVQISELKHRTNLAWADYYNNLLAYTAKYNKSKSADVRSDEDFNISVNDKDSHEIGSHSALVADMTRNDRLIGCCNIDKSKVIL